MLPKSKVTGRLVITATARISWDHYVTEWCCEELNVAVGGGYGNTISVVNGSLILEHIPLIHCPFCGIKLQKEVKE